VLNCVKLDKKLVAYKIYFGKQYFILSYVLKHELNMYVVFRNKVYKLHVNKHGNCSLKYFDNTDIDVHVAFSFDKRDMTILLVVR